MRCLVGCCEEDESRALFVSLALTSVWQSWVFPVLHSPWISVSILLSRPPPRILSSSRDPVEMWYTWARSWSRYSAAVTKGDSPSTSPRAALVT